MIATENGQGLRIFGALLFWMLTVGLVAAALAWSAHVPFAVMGTTITAAGAFFFFLWLHQTDAGQDRYRMKTRPDGTPTGLFLGLNLLAAATAAGFAALTWLALGPAAHLALSETTRISDLARTAVTMVGIGLTLVVATEACRLAQGAGPTHERPATRPQVFVRALWAYLYFGWVGAFLGLVFSNLAARHQDFGRMGATAAVLFAGLAILILGGRVLTRRLNYTIGLPRAPAKDATR